MSLSTVYARIRSRRRIRELGRRCDVLLARLATDDGFRQTADDARLQRIREHTDMLWMIGPVIAAVALALIGIFFALGAPT